MPLGNPGDLSPRARNILEQADVVLAEDTRRAGKIFALLQLRSQALMSFYEHNEEQRTPHVLQLLLQGRQVALISDAGTPLLSDPGYKLVRECRKQGISVSPIPGPSAPVAALSASGIPPVPFVFLGFAPKGDKEKHQFFFPYAEASLTLVFFDRKDRVFETLTAAHAVLGRREVCLARELTKTYEEFILFSLEDRNCRSHELLGELTVIIGPPEKTLKTSQEELERLISHWPEGNMKPKEMAKEIAEQTTGWSAKEIYQLMQKK